jgi:outer membrane receptor protein involved in Fe transport
LVQATNSNIDLKKHTIDNYAVFGQLAYQGFKQLKPHLDLRLDYVETAVDAANVYSTGRKVSI